MTTVDAIVLAGGRGARMGGVDKPAMVVGGQSMLAAALAAVAGCARTVVVGPYRPDLGSGIRQVREAPAGSGPVAAIAAGLNALADSDFSADLVVVLAADMPFLTPATVDALVSHAVESGAEAVFAADESGRPQYLAGVWRRTALRARVERLGTPVDRPMRALIPEHIAQVPRTDVADCDTPDDIARAQARAAPLTLDQARNMVRHKLSQLPSRHARLHLSAGAVLAEPLTAAEALPRFDVSAMDGYAVAGPEPWRVRRDIGYAGARRPARLRAGEAVRIATGAHIPEGTGHVVRDEFVHAAADGLHRLPDTPIRDDIRRRGEDWHPGDVLAPAGTPVTAALLSVATAAEVSEGLVRGPVHARIVLTGDEIRGDGPLHTGQTRDSIGPVLPDLLSWCGIHPMDRVHLRDTASGFDELLARATDRELLVIVGATGGGAADQLRASLDRTGAHLPVHRLRLRPGGSTVVAETTSGTAVLGLPGNPFAAVATLLALGPAIVEGLTGRPPRRAITGPLHNAADISGPAPRIVPARADPEGGWTGDPGIRTAHLAGLLDRDGLVIVPAHAENGTPVEFLPLPI